MRRKEEYSLIKEIGIMAYKDWSVRHICLPSLVTSLAVLESGWGRAPAAIRCRELFPRRKDGCGAVYTSLYEAIVSHNTYLALWKGKNQRHPNWERLIGSNYYILALQYLQDAEYPYSMEPDYEGRLVQVIEQYRLTEYDRED